MSALWGSARTVAPPVGTCLCGVLTSETDRSGRPAHRSCVDAVLATVDREAHPYDDFRGVGAWLREQDARVAAVADEVGRGGGRG